MAHSKAIDLTSTDISLVEADSPDVGTYRYLLNGSGLTRIQAILGDEVTIDQTDINTHPGLSRSHLPLQLQLLMGHNLYMMAKRLLVRLQDCS